MSLILSGNSGSMTVDSTAGVTFPAGGNPQAAPSKVLQVINATYSTAVSSTSNTFIDTGLTASITPLFTTSKILIFVNLPENFKTNNAANNDIGFNICRNGTQIVQFNSELGYTGSALGNIFSASYIYLDSPASVSSTAYKVQFKNTDGAGGTATVCQNGASSPNSITLMEIAQ